MKSRWIILALLSATHATFACLAQPPAGPAVPALDAPAAATTATERSLLFPIIENGKWGLIDATGKVVIQPKYDQIGPYAFDNPFYQRLPPAVMAQGMLFEAEPMPSGLLPYCQNRRCGVLSPTGAEVVPARYTGVGGSFEGGLLRVQGERGWGFIDEAGEEVIPLAYDWVQDFRGKVALVAIDKSHWTLLDSRGCRLIDPPWSEQPGFPFFDRPLNAIPADGRWGLMDDSGRWVVPPTFESLGAVHEGLASAKRDGKLGYIDTSGKWVIEPRFDSAWWFGCAGSKDVTVVEIGKQHGLINRKGELLYLTPNELRCDGGPLIRSVTPRVPGEDALSRRYGLIDETGRVVVEPRFHSIFDLSEGLYLAFLDGKPSYLDTEGRTVISGVGGGEFHEGFAVHIGPSRLAGYIDRTGRVVIEPAYERASDFAGGLAKVVHGDRLSYIDRTGRIVYSMRFPQDRR